MTINTTEPALGATTPEDHYDGPVPEPEHLAEVAVRQSRQGSPRFSETANTAETAETGGLSVFRAVSQIQAVPTQWLAIGYLPATSVTVLLGDEGIGKSLWWILVAASITTGHPRPIIGYPGGEPRDVLVIATEDGTGEVKERLRLAGADVDRVHIAVERRDPNVAATPTIGIGNPVISDGLRALRDQGRTVALVVVDAWLDTVPDGLNVRVPQDGRRALTPWGLTAEGEKVAVLLVAHSNRLDTGNVRDRYGSTIVLRQKARQTIYAARSPEGTLMIGPEKGNHTGEWNAVAYAVDVKQVRPATPTDPGTVARLRVQGETGAPIREHLATWHRDAKRAEHPTADVRAEAWLRTYLDANDGEVLVEVAKKEAHMAGHNPERLASIVRNRLGGYAGPGGPGAPWIYRQSPQSRQSSQSQRNGDSAAETALPGLSTDDIDPKKEPVR